MEETKITEIILSHSDRLNDGIHRYWVKMQADRYRAYAEDTFSELVTHLRELIKLKEWNCESILLEPKGAPDDAKGFTTEEISELVLIAPIASKINYSSKVTILD